MAKIDGLFKVMFDRGASDLHLVAGQRPILRLQGELEGIEGHGVLEHDYLREMFYEIAPNNKPTTRSGNLKKPVTWISATKFRRWRGSAIGNLIRDAKTFQIPSIIQTGKIVGMQSLDDAIQGLLTKKWISPDEAYDKCIDKNRFAQLLKTPPDALQ